MARSNTFCLCFVSACFFAGAGQGGAIELACLAVETTETAAVTVEKCACLQQIADKSLSNYFQDKVAAVIDEPDKSQKFRQSPFSADERFWEHYKHYGSLVQAHCS